MRPLHSNLFPPLLALAVWRGASGARPGPGEIFALPLLAVLGAPRRAHGAASAPHGAHAGAAATDVAQLAGAVGRRGAGAAAGHGRPAGAAARPPLLLLLPLLLLQFLVLALDQRDERVASPLKFHGSSGLDEPVEPELRRRSEDTKQLLTHRLTQQQESPIRYPYNLRTLQSTLSLTPRPIPANSTRK